MLRRGKLLIAGIAAAAVLVSVILILLIPRQYESYSLLIPAPHLASESLEDWMAVLGPPDRFRAGAPDEAGPPAARPSLAQASPDAATEPASNGLSADEVAFHLREGLVRVEPVEHTQMIRIVARASSPSEAARIAGIYTENYVRRRRAAWNARLASAATALAAELDERQAELAAVEAAALLHQTEEPDAELLRFQQQQEALVRHIRHLDDSAAIASATETAEWGIPQVVASPIEPARPVGPRAALILLLGLSGGLLLGLGAAAIRHRLDGVIYAPRHLRRCGHRLLGVMPVLAASARADDPLAPELDPFRRLLGKVRPGARRPVPRSLLVAGARAGAGTSTVAVNLALVAAQSGLRTLLIDGDLRRPTVQYSLRPTREIGEARQNLPLAFWMTDVPNLFALTPRDGHPQPTLIWTADRIHSLLDRAQNHFDLIIIDAPPVLMTADAGLIAAHTDGSILVARAGRTHDEDLLQAAADLQETGGTLLGTLLNGFHPSMAAGHRHTRS